MSIAACIYDFKLTVSELFEKGLTLCPDVAQTHEITGTSGSLSPTSSPAITKVHSGVHTLTAGAETIDLTSLAGPHASTITFLALKVRLIKIKAASTNTHAIVFVDGASNGYNIWGDASGSLTVPPDGVAMLYFANGLDAVASGDRTIDVSSTHQTATYSIILAAG